MKNVVLIVALATAVTACRSTLPTASMTVGGETLTVELAVTDGDQAQGLMDRKVLPARRGMLFVYKKDRRLSFWMKNTRIPLSIAFITKDGQVVQIEDMTPLSLEPVRSIRSVRYALEVNQGLFDELGVSVGDFVDLPAF